jgi:hypothetical protein
MYFSVPNEKIIYVVRRAYVGIREYMKTFIDKLDRTHQTDLEIKCAKDYSQLINNFRGYWS